jgi:uncharacterized membrane protein
MLLLYYFKVNKLLILPPIQSIEKAMKVVVKIAELVAR